MTWATHDGWKHGARCVIAGEPSFHQAGAVITHQGGGLFVVAHGVSSETNTGERARTHTVASSVQVMKFPVCLDLVIGDIAFTQHTNSTREVVLLC